MSGAGRVTVASCLVLSLLCAGAARADCKSVTDALKGSYSTGQAGTIAAAISDVNAQNGCSSEAIIAYKRQGASRIARLASEALAMGQIDEAEGIILQARTLHWAVQAVRGDIAAARGQRGEASRLYNAALDTLSDPELTVQKPALAGIAKRLTGLAQENMMLAGTLEGTLSRGAEPTGVMKFIARGLRIEKVGDDAEPYQADDSYAVADVDETYGGEVPEEYAISQGDAYVAPEQEAYVAPVVQYEEVKAEIVPGKDDYAVIDEAYKAVNKVFLPIRFGFDSDKLDHTGVKEAQRLASFLISHEVGKITIEGHTDDVGSEAYNLDLSLRRASNLRAFLVWQGVHTQIHVEGRGEHEPPEYFDTSIYTIEELRTIARRIEIVFDY